MPTAHLQETDRLQVRQDLYDTHIDICTPELLVLLQDNFDWQDLRRDLLPGVLGQFEMLGKTIYTHVVSNEYAARVHDPHTYDAVSRDLITRWAFPLVPEANLLPGCSYSYGRGCVYKENGVTLARSCRVGRDSVLGGGTTVGDGATIAASAVGRNCTIGAAASLSECYLWANVVVEEGAQLSGCLCCDGVVVRRGAVVPRGCVLGPGVVVGAGARLPPFARFAAGAAPEDDDDDDGDDDDGDGERTSRTSDDGAAAAEKAAGSTAAAAAAAADALGSDGVGALWKVVENASSMGFARPAGDGPLEDEASEEEDEGEMGDDDGGAVGEDEAFASEVRETVLRGVESGHTVDNVALELNSLKFAQDRTFADVVRAVVPALLEPLSAAGQPKKARVGALKKIVARWSELLGRFVQTGGDQDAMLDALEECCEGSAALGEVFEHALHALYDAEADVLSEEAIERWAAAAATSESAEVAQLLAQAQPFLTWLREAESDDEDEDE